MKVRPAGPLLLCAAVLASCSPKPKPQFAYDRAASFAQLKTFDWYADPSEDKGIGGSIVDNRWIEEHIKGGVERELEKKGMRRSQGDAADFYVDYHTRAAGILERDRYGQYTWWSPYTYVGSQYYREATLALDVRDSGKKLIWRGWVTGIVGKSPEEIDAQIRKYTAELFHNFPPSAAPARP